MCPLKCGTPRPVPSRYAGPVHEQYFSDAKPARDAELVTLEFSARGFELAAQVSSRVFSHQRVDLGTRQLLAQAPPLPASGHFLDLGCGWGPIAVSMAKEAPDAQVWAIDVNSRAVDLSARNAALNGCANVRALLADDALKAVAAQQIRFDVIWSNPPIRIGKEALHTLLLSWLEFLAPHGVAYLVVQRNLGADSLIEWLKASGFKAGKIASKKGYRIIEVAPRA